jgi:hypothetical protein
MKGESPKAKTWEKKHMNTKNQKEVLEGFQNRIDKLGGRTNNSQAQRFLNALDAQAQAITDAMQAVDAAIAALTTPTTPNR